MDLLTAFVRQLLLYGHTLAFAFAIVCVLREDMALLSARRVDARRLQATARTLARLLGLLWATGLALVALDTGLDLAALAERPKLLAKLAVVSLLTANGVLLHRLAFPVLTRRRAPRAPDRTASWCAALGAISTASWLYASFLGVARVIAPAMSLGAFLALYGLVLALAMAVAQALIRPVVARLIGSAHGLASDDADAPPSSQLGPVTEAP